ncbi:MAG: translation initiation factor IF-2 [Kiritimatiellae bacterium]|nr:translation initiation factor IF-2 [Kiritimatiellia bacterium]
MRLFELARELKTSNRDLIRQAKALEVEVDSFIYLLDDADVAALRRGFKPRTSIEVADDEAAMNRALETKRQAAREALASAVAKESEVLAAAAARARQALAEQEARRRGEPVAAAAPEAPAEEPAAVAPAEVPAAETAPAPETPSPAATAIAVDAVPPAVARPPAPPAPRPAMPAGLEALPQRPLQAPRPELVLKPVAPPPPAPKPAAPDAKAKATATADAAKTLKKEKKAPRALHPVDEEDEAAILPGSLSKVVRDTPARTAPARRGAEHENARDSRGKPQRPAVAPQKSRGPSAGITVSAEANVLKIHGAVAVKELADKLGTRPNVVIAELMKLGILASINQSVDAETAGKVAAQHGFTVELEKSRRSSDNRPVLKSENADDDIPEDRPDQLLPRPPVVTFLGHVDHGKTSLMDRIRQANVAAGEAGGITQHIAAYTVDVNGQKITFLDTPGHAAFSAMRARGATLTDIAVIIIAADDGIMPQTQEAIKHARAAGVTIMVAINKCDLPQANPMRVMQQLQGENLTPEEWGGDTVVTQVSAVTGDGVGGLLDMILLQAEVLELTANPNRRANGTVVEAQMKPGSGPIASILVTGGTLNVGDVVLCGEHYGRIRAIIDSNDNRVKSIGPSGAARIMGLSGVPEAGAEFRVMINDKRARELAAEYAQQKKEEVLGGVTQARSADDIFKKLHEAEKLELNVILRADVQGSVEAVQESIEQIKSEKVVCNVIQSSTGSITSNDVQRAGSGKALIIGFNVAPDAGVNSEARHFGVRIKTFRIIYELLEFIKQEMLDLIPVEYREVVRGHALVKQLFSLSHVGVAAGSLVTDGVMTMEGKARVLRNKKVVHTGAFSSIRHFKDEVKQVTQAQECGILLAGFESFQEGDVIECFSFEELPKAL